MRLAFRGAASTTGIALAVVAKVLCAGIPGVFAAIYPWVDVFAAWYERELLDDVAFAVRVHVRACARRKSTVHHDRCSSHRRVRQQQRASSRTTRYVDSVSGNCSRVLFCGLRLTTVSVCVAFADSCTTRIRSGLVPGVAVRLAATSTSTSSSSSCSTMSARDGALNVGGSGVAVAAVGAAKQRLFAG